MPGARIGDGNADRGRTAGLGRVAVYAPFAYAKANAGWAPAAPMLTMVCGRTVSLRRTSTDAENESLVCTAGPSKWAYSVDGCKAGVPSSLNTMLPSASKTYVESSNPSATRFSLVTAVLALWPTRSWAPLLNRNRRPRLPRLAASIHHGQI